MVDLLGRSGGAGSLMPRQCGIRNGLLVIIVNRRRVIIAALGRRIIVLQLYQFPIRLHLIGECLGEAVANPVNVNQNENQAANPNYFSHMSTFHGFAGDKAAAMPVTSKTV
jgi:hypothetical protein